MKYAIIAVIIVLALLTFNKKDKATMELTHNDTILAMGDSLTYGFGASPEESYPQQLSNLTRLKVLNAGINGETSQEGLKRLPTLLGDPSVKLMILCFGGNDILQKKPLSELKNNLTEMIHLAKEKNIEVVLVSVPNLSLFGLSPLDLYEEVAEEENIPLVSGVLADILSQPSLKNDQIHPNASGYKKMADEIYKGLKGHGLIAH
jgi:lysophospholipase L1-like esterase